VRFCEGPILPARNASRSDAGGRHSSTPTLRLQGFEDDEDGGSTELAEVLPAIAFSSLVSQLCREQRRENEALRGYRLKYLAGVWPKAVLNTAIKDETST